MKTDYSAYPPQLAADMEITEQQDGERLVFIVGSASVGRYLILRETEAKVLRLIGSALTPGALCAEFQQQYGATLKLAMLTKFLATGPKHPEELVKSLIQDVETFCEGRAQSDDMCLVCLRRSD